MRKKQPFSDLHPVFDGDTQPLSLQGKPVTIPQEMHQAHPIAFQIQGIHCASCVMVIERQLKKLEGVQTVQVDARTGKAELSCARVPLLTEAQQAVQANGYTVLPWQDGKPAMQPQRGVRDGAEIGIIVLLLLGLFWLFSRLPFVPHGFGISERMSYGVVFVIGLVASISSCMAATGGLLLGMTATGRSRLVKAQGTLLFHLGRLLSYTIFGAALGGIGSFFTLSPHVNAVAVILSSFVMLLLGMQLLRLVPPWIRALQPRLPLFLTQGLDAASGRPSTIVSFLIGAATFFLPCGFTQALQLYVLSRGNAVTGALTMLAFALGTLPALLSLSVLSSLFTGTVQRYVVKVSGVLVLLIGLASLQSGFALAGLPLPSLAPGSSAQTSGGRPQERHLAPLVHGKQVVSMKVIGFTYVPSTFTVVQGVPVTWYVDGRQAEDCAQVLLVPALGLTVALQTHGLTTITFTPREPGTLRFHCPLAMTTSGAMFTVLPNTHPGGGKPRVART
jgi:sulfite exporter TauE/SafE/copper chaperone CopZ